MTVDCEQMVSYFVPGNNTSGRGKIGSSMGFSVWISSAAVHLKTFLLFRFALFCGDDKEILTILSNLHKPNSLTLVCPLLLLVVTATADDDEEKHVQPDEDEGEDEDMLSDGFELWLRSGEVKWEDVVARHDEVRAGTWVEDTMVYIEVCKNQAECKLIRIIIAFQLPYSIQEFEATRRRKLHLEHNPTYTLELELEQ